MVEKYAITYDVGTTAVKTCLFRLGEKMTLVEDDSQGYALSLVDNGGAEQNPEDWWRAMCATTKSVIKKSKIKPNQIAGISFCAQMQGLVLVDRNGAPVRPAMSYMDNRAEEQMTRAFNHGVKIDGVNVSKLLKSVLITGVVASSSKDPVWKYLWVKENEPEQYNRIFKWLDVKEYLILKSSGEYVMTEDSAFATMLLDVRKNRRQFSKRMCNMLGINFDHMPKIIKSTDIAGTITDAVSKELGLSAGTPVFGGGGDASLIGIGAGAADVNDTHVYIGTSGWVSTVSKRQALDISCKIAGIVGANDATYNYFAELETAGKCIEWVKNHLAYEETVSYMNQAKLRGDYEDIAVDLYDYMMDSIENVPAGSRGIIFTPWLHGNRCPFEDTAARGMFFNIGIETKKTELIHAVIEGVCYHLKWQLECSKKKMEIKDTIRMVGGGALAPRTCQILADVLNLKVAVVDNPQNAGAMGAAIIVAVGLGMIDGIEQAGRMIRIDKTYYPNHNNNKIYNCGFEVFKNLYYNNKKSFKMMNA